MIENDCSRRDALSFSVEAQVDTTLTDMLSEVQAASGGMGCGYRILPPRTILSPFSGVAGTGDTTLTDKPARG